MFRRGRHQLPTAFRGIAPTASADSVQVGKLIGQGVQKCVQSWGIATPKVFTLNGGEDTDPNAVSFARKLSTVVWGDDHPRAGRQDQCRGLDTGR